MLADPLLVGALTTSTRGAAADEHEVESEHLTPKTEHPTMERHGIGEPLQTLGTGAGTEQVFTTRPVITGRRGVVTAGHYLAAMAGMRMLEAGGNAIDAGVAAGFALALLEPHNNGLGGESPILIYHARSRRVAAINGQGVAPRAATIDWFAKQGISLIPGDGLLAATVPSQVDNWITALSE